MINQPTFGARVSQAMAEVTAWMAAEREQQRRQLARRRPDQGWQEVAATIAEKRQSRQGAE
ncbi:hypothetical protein [Geminicoccus flavidas]|uniref:hypothetical protein n=1 Tax=Geminicoccus flavidas TaxID=2506407 RepID=UPI00135A6901|nr:hypothetical protein [Geminicoccus flavidas]